MYAGTEVVAIMWAGLVLMIDGCGWFCKMLPRPSFSLFTKAETVM